MSSVDSFIRTQILTFPLLFPNRTAVLEHVFCVIGNGYEWSKDGNVVPNDFYERELWDKDEELTRIEEDLEAYGPVLQEALRPAMMESYREELSVVEQVDQRIHQTPPITDIYPQSDYALLMNVPENVTPEWRAAADEARELAIAAGWVFPV